MKIVLIIILLIPFFIATAQENCWKYDRSRPEWTKDTITSINNTRQFNTLNVYPNPVNNALIIEVVSETGGNAVIDIIEASTGKIVWNNEQEISSGVNEIEWDTKGNEGKKLAPGTYIIKVKSAGRNYSDKIILN